jgi:hypothetical protein
LDELALGHRGMESSIVVDDDAQYTFRKIAYRQVPKFIGKRKPGSSAI